MTETLRSGELAAAAGVNVQTLRYYERRGLLPDPQRSLGGHRAYGPDAVTALGVIKAAQRLGFSLDEIAELLDIGAHRRSQPDLRERAQDKLAEVETKIAQLGAIRDTLREVIAAGCSDLTECACAACCPIPFSGITGPHPGEGSDHGEVSPR